MAAALKQHIVSSASLTYTYMILSGSPCFKEHRVHLKTIVLSVHHHYLHPARAHAMWLLLFLMNSLVLCL